jgi:OTU domain-containing protein 6
MELARAGARASDAEELSLADALRARACDELVARREDVEWFIEGDFETYVERMRNPRAWGGEPEILMLARALRTPIEVFVVVEGENASAREGGELRSIGRYGEDEEEEEDGDEEEEEEEGEEEGASGGAEGGGGVAVLFHGAGHYEALTRCDDDDAARR